jgi:hypothetical protein
MIITPFASFARPADTTAYTIGDLVANNTTAASVSPMEFAVKAVGGSGVIRRVRLFKDDETTTAAAFKLHLFTAAPVVTNGDNGALAVTTVENYLGYAVVDMSTGAMASATDLMKMVDTAIYFRFPDLASKLYGLIEALAAYTPSSGETFKVTLEIEGGD